MYFIFAVVSCTCGCRRVVTIFVSAWAAQSHFLLLCGHNKCTEANGSSIWCFVFFPFYCPFLFSQEGCHLSTPQGRLMSSLSTWSLRYLLSFTERPSHCFATWNAWLASSLKPSWHGVLKHHWPLRLSPSSSHVCRSQGEDSCTAQSTGKQAEDPSLEHTSAPQGLWHLFKKCRTYEITYVKIYFYVSFLLLSQWVFVLFSFKSLLMFHRRTLLKESSHITDQDKSVSRRFLAE